MNNEYFVEDIVYQLKELQEQSTNRVLTYGEYLKIKDEIEKLELVLINETKIHEF